MHFVYSHWCNATKTCFSPQGDVFSTSKYPSLSWQLEVESLILSNLLTPLPKHNFCSSSTPAFGKCYQYKWCCARWPLQKAGEPLPGLPWGFPVNSQQCLWAPLKLPVVKDSHKQETRTETKRRRKKEHVLGKWPTRALFAASTTPGFTWFGDGRWQPWCYLQMNHIFLGDAALSEASCPPERAEETA